MDAQSNMNAAAQVNITQSTKILIAIIVALMTIIIVGGGWSWRVLHKVGPPAKVGSQAALSLNTSQAPPDVLSATLSPSGFAPNEISHSAGRFNLKVTNHSEQQEIVLRLKKASGEQLSEVRVSEKVNSWTGQFDLAPGVYTLSEASHPGWTYQITLTAP